MSSDWPRFDSPIPLPDGSTFTATFDSYDQRNEECYYLVTLHEGDADRTIVAQVSTSEVVDWAEPAFTELLLDGLRRVAATGKSNTSYRGYNR